MIVAVGLLVAFVVVYMFARRGRATRGCRWREDRRGDKGRLRKYICAACGAEAFTATDGPPERCLADHPPS